jgi:hypothetical protein
MTRTTMMMATVMIMRAQRVMKAPMMGWVEEIPACMTTAAAAALQEPPLVAAVVPPAVLMEVTVRWKTTLTPTRTKREKRRRIGKPQMVLDLAEVCIVHAEACQLLEVALSRSGTSVLFATTR